MNQYIDIYREYEELIRMNAPACMNPLREKAFEDFRRLGFPSLKDENYRYTDVAKAFAPNYGLNLSRLKTPLNPLDVFSCDVPNMSTQLYFVVNDSFYSELMPKASLPEGIYAGSLRRFMEIYPEKAIQYYGSVADSSKDAITALNTMFAQNGFVIYISKGLKLKRPIQLINTFRTKTDIMANRRLLIILEQDSEAQLLVCDHTMDNVQCLSTQVVEIIASENSRFDYYDLEESSVRTTRFSTVYARQKTASNVLINGITLNNGLTRNDYYITLEGEHAETTLCGMAILDGNQHVDTWSHVNHAAPHCKSTELFKNILDNASSGSFSGRILVCKDSQKTEAYQLNRNLCLSREARMYSKPQLEIYADDVKCSHGMSTGQLDEQALFYMQSRGISHNEAKLLLSIAFTADVTGKVRLEALKDRLQYLTEKRFRGELAQCAGCNTCCK